MKIIQVFQSNQPLRVAFVGAGGKTTALFQLARQLPLPVFITTTTHLGSDQSRLADHHIVLKPDDELNETLQLMKGVILLTGELSNQRYSSLSASQLQALKQYADIHSLPILVEADGSRQLPIKAPAEHEPVIPGWCTTIVVVTGLSALGKPISVETVHRLDEFCRLSDSHPGELITPGVILKVLTNPQGGLKSIPSEALRIGLLNQVDTDNLSAQAAEIAQNLLSAYDKVIIAALEKESVKACYQKTAGIILAAGSSSRFGQSKQLLKWRGIPFIRHVAMRALDAGLMPVIVVLGAVDNPIRAVLKDLPVRFVLNQSWCDGQSTSIRSGLGVMDDKCGACIFLLADQPQVTTDILASLVAEHHQSLAPIIAPLIKGQRGNPVLFDRVTFPDLLSVPGDQGGRAIFSRYPIRWLEWLDESLLVDIDTPDDMPRLGEVS